MAFRRGYKKHRLATRRGYRPMTQLEIERKIHNKPDWLILHESMEKKKEEWINTIKNLENAIKQVGMALTPLFMAASKIDYNNAYETAYNKVIE